MGGGSRELKRHFSCEMALLDSQSVFPVCINGNKACTINFTTTVPNSFTNESELSHGQIFEYGNEQTNTLFNSLVFGVPEAKTD
jgi:hypothetical protein